MGVSSDMRSSRVRRQAAKKPNKERTVQVRFSDEELAALDAICSEKKMTRSAFLRSCVEKVQGGDVEPTYVVTRNADAERMASEAKCIGVNVNQIARALNAESKSHPGSLSPGVLGECKTGLEEVRGELSKLTDEVDGLRTDFGKDVFRAMALLWPDVPERMSYTELGEGKKRTRNIREKTNRIAAQMGDMGTREDFIWFCSAMRRQSQGTRLNEGYELRVSWSPEELSKDSPEDIQRACEYGYALCKEVAPNAPCWVTVHTDGEGGCVHVHATIANHDLVSGTAIAHGTDHATVKRKNDRLSREMGFTVVGPEPARERTTWAERKGQFGIESFERVLGNRVADARDHASNMEEFLEELKVRGVERTETRKVDEKTGEETVGWSYKSRDPYGKSRRKRRRRASNLADDLTREGIEAYFEAKQRELEVPQQDAPAPEVLPDVPETAEPAAQPSKDSALDVYDLDRAYVSEMASDLQKAHIHRSREAGKSFMDERYQQIVEARNHPDEQLAKLREDVDAARREFHASKEARDTMQHPCPGLLAGMHVFAKAGRNAKDPVSRMMADMTAMMLRMLIQEALAEERRRQREEAERRVYESRKNMWDAEKRLKAAEKALSDEDEREKRLKSERMQRRVKEAQGVSGKVQYQHEDDSKEMQ